MKIEKGNEKKNFMFTHLKLSFEFRVVNSLVVVQMEKKDRLILFSAQRRFYFPSHFQMGFQFFFSKQHKIKWLFFPYTKVKWNEQRESHL